MLHYKFQNFAWASVGYTAHGFLFGSLFRPSANNSSINIAAIFAIGLAVLAHIISALVILICFSVLPILASNGRLETKVSCVFPIVAAWGLTVLLGLGLSSIYLLAALLFVVINVLLVWKVPPNKALRTHSIQGLNGAI